MSSGGTASGISKVVTLEKSGLPEREGLLLCEKPLYTAIFFFVVVLIVLQPRSAAQELVAITYVNCQQIPLRGQHWAGSR